MREWAAVRAAEAELFAKRGEFLALDPVVRERILAEALDTPHERGAALRMIELLDVADRLRFFPHLVRLAAAGHSDLFLVRQVIAGLPRPWVHSYLGNEMWPLIAKGTDEEYRRFAELVSEIGPAELLIDLVERARASDDPEIREVAEDFGGGRPRPRSGSRRPDSDRSGR